MEIYLMRSKSLHRVYQLIDLSVGINDSDLMLIKLLNDSTRPYNLVLTKADKVKSKHVAAKAKKVIEQVRQDGNVDVLMPIVHIVSTYTSYGVAELMSGFI